MRKMVSCRVCRTSFEAGSYRDELCPGCGALVPVGVRPCPCCSLPLGHRDIDTLIVDECTDCGGVFLDHQTYERLFEDHSLMRASAFVASLSHGADALAPSGSRPALMCPACAEPMQRRLHDSGAGIVYDVCPAHGVFFEPGKLPAIVEFMRKRDRHAERGGPEPATDAEPASSSKESGGQVIINLLVILGYILFMLIKAAATHH